MTTPNSGLLPFLIQFPAAPFQPPPPSLPYQNKNKNKDKKWIPELTLKFNHKMSTCNNLPSFRSEHWADESPFLEQGKTSWRKEGENPDQPTSGLMRTKRPVFNAFPSKHQDTGTVEQQLSALSYLACYMPKGTLQDHPSVGMFLLPLGLKSWVPICAKNFKLKTPW